MHIRHITPALWAFMSSVLHMLAAARPQAAYAAADTAYNAKAPSEGAKLVCDLSDHLLFAAMALNVATFMIPSTGDRHLLQRNSSY